MPFSSHATDDQFATLSHTYLADETELAMSLATRFTRQVSDHPEIETRARDLTLGLLKDAESPATVDAFLKEYALSSQEGILLMRLAESLIRTPDNGSAAQLLRDKLLAGTWLPHARADQALVKLGSIGLSFCKTWIRATGGATGQNLLSRLGDRVTLTAVRSAIGLLGRHFVLGTSIDAATKRAETLSDYGATYSYDMLGEAALTADDATRYFKAYQRALTHLAATAKGAESLHQSPALSVKLSALHPRYELAQRERCVPVLTDRLLELCDIAKAANIGLTVDAEEADRLEVSLQIFEHLLAADRGSDWGGLGLAVQAYQKRALPALQWISSAVQTHRRQITVRLVKGAYWDSEIKRAQTLGLDTYPVFTRKEHTDISYLACASELLGFGDHIYPQFATHNAQTAAAISHLAGDRRSLEFQRLHGMSDGLHRRLALEDGFATRTYAPVGQHKDLLPYLVRRLLENGANSSFVNQIMDNETAIRALVEDPVTTAQKHGFSPHPRLQDPRRRGDETRRVARGVDLTQAATMDGLQALSPPELSSPDQTAEAEQTEVRSPNDRAIRLGTVRLSTVEDIETAATRAARSSWPDLAANERGTVLRRAAELLERDRMHLMQICVHEAGKTWPDAEAELREAVDFLNYYADQAERSEIRERAPLGLIACISPWNFPLAIFMGQVGAALSVGNTVIAKPAEQTPLIAIAAVDRLYEAGLPHDALHLVIGDGRLGAALVEQAHIKGVCFTGSTQTAKRIAKSLADTGRGDCPLIAETGGINAMIVDSTALLEQAVKDVVRSAFQSAGQRCSASRLVCVQADVADAFIEMLSGAMKELKVGPSDQISSDLGPIIDETAHQRLSVYIEEMKSRFPVIGTTPARSDLNGPYLAPIAFEVNSVSDLKDETFGPVLHLVRFKGSKLDRLLKDINALGFGLTMGLHTRIDARVKRVARQAKVGNLYINRDQIGAIVGEQPFGGEGLSGTGPKAGGPNYLLRLSRGSKSNRDELTMEHSLPGPTGETNTLRHFPRGKLLCLGGDAQGDLAAQIAIVKATGNKPIVATPEKAAKALHNPALAGVLIDGKRRDEIAALLARREGPILPLLSASDDLYRFQLERVITIDTTAAGGNASLLASI